MTHHPPQVREGGLVSPEADLAQALEHAAHVLPAQNPIDRFVHHNPLHAFEEVPFEEAVEEAAALYDYAPWWPEERYRDALQHGRISQTDLTSVIEEAVEPGPVGGLVDRRELVRLLLVHPIQRLSGVPLAWHLSETDALSRLRDDLSTSSRASIEGESGGDESRATRLLWEAARDRGEQLPTLDAGRGRVRLRLRDRLIANGHRDTDRLVNPVLIRWSAAYLDHGIAYWPQPDREAGFLPSFLQQFFQMASPGRPWLRLASELAERARRERWSAERLSIHCLDLQGAPPSTWKQVVTDSLLALRGWAGMFQRLADRPDTAPEPLGFPTALVEVLAVRLLLDLSAASWVLGVREGLADAVARLRDPRPGTPASSVWFLFQLAQVLGVSGLRLRALGAPQLGELLTEANAWDDLVRRRLWHRAYERRFVRQSLGGIGTHAARVASIEPAPVRAQVAFCIDDREESIRRLVEEHAPWIETVGVAGNFGISMYYQGLHHGRSVALGPAGFEPRHAVRETLGGEQPEKSRLQGLVRHQIDVGSQTLLRGALVTLGGSLSVLPLGLRLLAPRLHQRLTQEVGPEQTQLTLEHDPACPHDAHGRQLGFTLDEQVDIVLGTLEFMALGDRLAPLVVCCGHGSASVNNPHAAAYNCGACGGGQGGPNARAFAQMANDPRVRRALAERGHTIPEGTWFVGGYHNTAADDITYYDVERIPVALRPLFEEVTGALESACDLDALERCRKFDPVPLDATPAQAREHVRERTVDLAQPRPEYNHSTNALCLVGRRHWSRGLFLDRRAFLCNYDPTLDPDGTILERLIGMAVPVGAGINLEYWFGAVDDVGYGSGTKTGHNVSGLIGVMDGHQSDLRTGLYSQMVELHEPVRLLCVVEAEPATLLAIAERNPAVGRLVVNHWVHLATLDPETGQMQIFRDGAFHPWQPEEIEVPTVSSSERWFLGTRGLLPAATITPDGGGA